MEAALLASKANTWADSTLTTLETPEVKVTRENSMVRVRISGKYPRPQLQKSDMQAEEKKSDEPLDQEFKVDQPQLHVPAAFRDLTRHALASTGPRSVERGGLPRERISTPLDSRTHGLARADAKCQPHT